MQVISKVPKVEAAKMVPTAEVFKKVHTMEVTKKVAIGGSQQLTWK